MTLHRFKPPPHNKMPSLTRFLPKTPSDTFAFFFTLFGINLIFFFQLFCLLPLLDHLSAFWWCFHVINGGLLYVNSLGSFWKVITTDTSTAGIVLPTLLKPGWRFCSGCECNSPPRSFHCHTCNRCILRRDHHCVFTGNCIGLKNYRYYILLCFNCWLAGAYSAFMNLTIVDQMFGGVGLASLLKTIFPFFMWTLGYVSFVQMLKCGVILLCVGVTCTMGALLSYHLRNMYCGQITTERTHKIFKYDLGWKENIRSVFGERWRYAWLSPWLASEIPGDGLSFPVKGEYESTKDI